MSKQPNQPPRRSRLTKPNLEFYIAQRAQEILQECAPILLSPQDAMIAGEINGLREIVRAFDLDVPELAEGK